MGGVLKLAAAMLLVGVVAGEALSQPRTATFEVGDVGFRMALPSGFCLPQGDMIERARKIASADDQNDTDLTLVPCAAAGAAPQAMNQFFVIKTPKRAITTDVERQELLQSMAAELKDPAGFSSQNAMDHAAKGLENSFGGKVELTGTLHPVGEDDICGYLGGTISSSSNGQTTNVATGVCITSIGKRVLYVYWFGPDASSAGIEALLHKAKASAQAIEAVPHG